MDDHQHNQGGARMTASLPDGTPIASWERDANGKLVDGSITNAEVTERELATKAVAPRVTEGDVDGAIDSTWCFTAAEGCLGAERSGTPHWLQPPVGASSPLRLLTICVLVMRNGFTVIGESACASAANFDPDIGRRLAINDAKRKVWRLLGYALRDRLSRED